MNTRPFSLAVFLAVSAAALSLPPATLASETEKPVGERVKDRAAAVGDYAGDALTTTKVKTAFVANDTVKALDVSVETKDGVVYLTGAVETSEQSATAERVASEVDGVRSVVNQLTLKPNQ